MRGCVRWKKKVRVGGITGGPDGVHVGNFTSERDGRPGGLGSGPAGYGDGFVVGCAALPPPLFSSSLI